MTIDLVLMKSKPTYGAKGAKMVVGKKTVGKLYWTYTPETKILTIDYISVSAKERKKGYARAAIQALMEDHPMATQVKTTTIRKTNKGSIALFKGLGFTMDKTKGGQWVGVLKPQPTKIEPDQALLLRLFVATHFHTLLDHSPEKFKSKKIGSMAPLNKPVCRLRPRQLTHWPHRLRSRQGMSFSIFICTPSSCHLRNGKRTASSNGMPGLLTRFMPWRTLTPR